MKILPRTSNPPPLQLPAAPATTATAKAEPGRLTYASSGTGTLTQMAVELVSVVAKINLLHVPYKGAGPQMIGIISGEVAITFATAPSGVPYVKNKQLRAIGVSGANRIPALPDVQTIAEGGVPGYLAVGWNGLMGPANDVQ